ncbi:FAD/NAD(P)-binding domain-containing protein [Coniophora puteana RWD-64-598 SS2]|uniref:FAD/NAD(P)-binding domain-containing protein n=1 Tax=Coniophora puteana (strain RWD-64-598) TaxID=741705 RepID=A0A5M3N6N5_CONPW|nr:FAD/NAD(P)-binding domain-containing protein [Coniophora puteana RWD-64-598 SS2]EIW86938.1 FAD/NAD(P)-binding domain-containing protein [Coniophora puteana RWD-64-598 SS2]
MSSRKDLRIAIVGGGMVGVACAVRLMKAGLDVNLFEAASKFGELGAGVAIGPNGLRALEGLGISKTLHSEAEDYHDMGTFQFISDLPGHEFIFDHMIIFPLKNGQMVNVVLFCSDRSEHADSKELPLEKWVTAVDKQEVVERFEDCGPDTQAIISLLDDNPKKWAIHELRPTLTHYTRENVALVGDAAHASSPHLGAGVGQGFEDAHFICELLVDLRTNTQNLQDVFEVYDRYRRPRANDVLKSSAATGELYDSWREDSVAEKFHSPLGKLFGWVFDHDLRADINAARRDLENNGIWQSGT